MPVVQVRRSRRVLGGAGNTAANIVALGGAATLIGLAGTDEAGRTLKQATADAKLNFVPIDHGRATLRKMRIVSHQQQMMRLDYEDVQPPDAAIEAAVYSAVEAHVDSCDIVVISDYAKGLLSLALTHAIIARAHQAGRLVIVDPRPQHRDFYIGCDYLTPNWKEARALLRASEADPTPGRVAETAKTLAAALRCNVVLTLGAHGIAYCSVDGSEEFSQPTHGARGVRRQRRGRYGRGRVRPRARLANGSRRRGVARQQGGQHCRRQVRHSHGDARRIARGRRSPAHRVPARPGAARGHPAREGPAHRHGERLVRSPARRSPVHPERSEAFSGRAHCRHQQRRLSAGLQGAGAAARARAAAGGDAARAAVCRLRSHLRRTGSDARFLPRFSRTFTSTAPSTANTASSATSS